HEGCNQVQKDSANRHDRANRYDVLDLRSVVEAAVALQLLGDGRPQRRNAVVRGVVDLALFERLDGSGLDRRRGIEVGPPNLEVQDLLTGLLQRRGLFEHAPDVRERDRVEPARTAYR